MNRRNNVSYTEMEWWLRAGRARASFMVEESCYLEEGHDINWGGKQSKGMLGKQIAVSKEYNVKIFLKKLKVCKRQ